MKNEKMIVVEKNAKWWMSVVASASLAVGVLGGYTIHSLTNGASTANQRSTVQANMPQHNNQQGHQMQGPGGQPPQGQGNENGMPPQMNGQEGQPGPGGNSGPGGQPPQGENGQQNHNSKKKPSNADGSTKNENKDFNEVRSIQERILLAYKQDFSKHAPNELVPRLRMLWNSIPSQLAKENKKFIYSLVREGARAKEYEMVLMWLIDCGLVYKVNRVVTPKLPLKAYQDLKAFKLFLLDIGLLTCMTGLNQSTLIDGNELFVEFKGALTEQFVLQQFVTIKNLDTYYYTNSRGSCEINFLIDDGENVIPVEVKAKVNLKAKSLKVYKEKYNPKISVRVSMNDYKREEWLLNLPIYMVEETANIIKKEKNDTN